MDPKNLTPGPEAVMSDMNTEIGRMQTRFNAIAEIIGELETRTGKSLDAFRYHDHPSSPEYFLSFGRPVALSNEPAEEVVQKRHPGLDLLIDRYGLEEGFQRYMNGEHTAQFTASGADSDPKAAEEVIEPIDDSAPARQAAQVIKTIEEMTNRVVDSVDMYHTDEGPFPQKIHFR